MQAVVHKVNLLSDEVERLGGGGGAGVTPEDIGALRDDIKRDVVRERAMMEASLEHRIDQQVNRLMIDKDQSASISRLEKRMDGADAALAKLDAKLDAKVSEPEARPAAAAPAPKTVGRAKASSGPAPASTMDLEATK
eukprot:jgi/Tetstr1/453976/TSEL_040895.t1